MGPCGPTPESYTGRIAYFRCYVNSLIAAPIRTGGICNRMDTELSSKKPPGEPYVRLEVQRKYSADTIGFILLGSLTLHSKILNPNGTITIGVDVQWRKA